MEAESQRPKGREGAILALNEAIEAINPAKILNVPPGAKTVFGSVRTLLTLIRVCFLFFCDNPLRIHTVARTRWLTNRITLSSGYTAPMSVERFIEGQIRRKQMSSISPCMML